MKRATFFLCIVCLFIPCCVFAQDLKVITEKRQDGTIAEQYEVLKKRQSVKSGFYKRYYFGGQVNVTANFSNNLPDGPFESLHQDGQTAVRGEFANGMKSGDWIYYDTDGRVAAEGSFSNDLEEGIWSFYCPGGYRVSATYQKGKRNGPWELLYNDERLASCTFTDGLPDGGSLRSPADSLYRYADSLYMAPEVGPNFNLLKFSKKRIIKLVIPEEPRFVGGIPALREYLYDCIRIPGSAFPKDLRYDYQKLTCYVKMIVSQFGTIENVEILRSFSKDLDDLIIQALMEMPAGIPAINRNVPVRSSLTIPFSFEIIRGR